MRNPPPALRRFLEPYDSLIARLFFAARKEILAAAPEATELIYDAYNAVSAAYSFTDRLREAFCHVAAYSNYVNLGFNRGAGLPDPEKLLVGTGARIRHIRVGSPVVLKQPGVRRLVKAAVAQGLMLNPSEHAQPQSIVKAVCANKRRPA